MQLQYAHYGTKYMRTTSRMQLQVQFQCNESGKPSKQINNLKTYEKKIR